MMEGAPSFVPEEARANMTFAKEADNNTDLIKELVAHHEEAFLDDPYTKSGMDAEQKEEYLRFVTETAQKSDNQNERRAAEIFLKNVKGGTYEN